jgi:phosphomannomutase
MGAFKAYDIRGVWGEDVTADLVYRIGYFLPKLLGCNQIVVGRDIRLSSDDMFSALSSGIIDSGADVLNLGVASTPMVYFSTVFFKVGGSVQITASHNPAKYNGLKVSRANAVPVGGDTGLAELEKMCSEQKVVPAAKKGKIIDVDGKTPYLAFLRKYLPDFSNLKLAIDCSNGMSSYIIPDLLGKDHIYLNNWFDGHFPAHEPNPLDPSTCNQLEKAVLDNHCDVGIIYDGDADRVMFVDEKGRYIQADFSMALIGMKVFQHKGDKCVADIRTSKSTTEFLTKLGYDVLVWKVGHVHAKAKIRETGAIFGGELAGHYYFREFFCCDSAAFATMMMLSVLADAKRNGKSFSALIDSIVKYCSSGEINFKLEHKDEAMQALYDRYAAKADHVYDFDGYRIEYPTWWFNVRKSNTEPYLRLVLEAQTTDEMNEKISEITSIIKQFS